MRGRARCLLSVYTAFPVINVTYQIDGLLTSWQKFLVLQAQSVETYVFIYENASLFKRKRTIYH